MCDGYNLSMSIKSGFLELSHVADTELAVWADNLSNLFRMAAMGMASIVGMELEDSKPDLREIELCAIDNESLLVRFLDELLFWIEVEGSGFLDLDIEVLDLRLFGSIKIAPVTSIRKEIKAVTWHNIQIQQGDQGYNVRIVFDI